MKNLKKLCATLLTAGLMYAGPIYAENGRQFKIPKYSENDVIKKIQGHKSNDLRRIEYSVFYIDRNRDGKVDMIECEIKYIINNEEGRHEKRLYIDDNLDGKVDREIDDDFQGDVFPDSDGIYDSEMKVKINIDELIKMLENSLNDEPGFPYLKRQQ